VAQILTPTSPEELAQALASCREPVQLEGAGSKRQMGGPVEPAGVEIRTTRLRRVLQYEPNDLTISVEAGLPWRELTALLTGNRQMVPLDPAFADQATVGGVVATNSSGPRRRLYGTARDLIIGMKFATLEGKVVQSGGMVVKNVAGLDMAKLLIGSFGTLAGIALVNFKLTPMPEATRTFMHRCSALDDAIAARDGVLQSVLQPMAVDLLNPAAARELQLESKWTLLIQAGGSTAVLDRYARELPGAEAVEGDAESALWQGVREFTPRWLACHPQGLAARLSTTLDRVAHGVRTWNGPVVSRAGSGVTYGYMPEAQEFVLAAKGVVEFAPDEFRKHNVLWPGVGSDFEMMKRIKGLFDPNQLLNRGRLYGRI
jgi:glycolate oxidase FAD binding subunit